MLRVPSLGQMDRGMAARIYLCTSPADMRKGFDSLAELEEEFLPGYWRRARDAAAKAGHGGGDYFEVLDFVDAARGIRPAEIGIHESMDMTLPGLVSQLSILKDGEWLEVPDSRAW